MPSYTFSDDPARLDVDVVWAFLSEHAYWGRWRTRADLEQQLARAWRVVGCYDDACATVGFCRAVSDGVALAYLADVFVLPAHRGADVGPLELLEVPEDDHVAVVPGQKTDRVVALVSSRRRGATPPAIELPPPVHGLRRGCWPC